jgi:hypothetical protein
MTYLSALHSRTVQEFRRSREVPSGLDLEIGPLDSRVLTVVDSALRSKIDLALGASASPLHLNSVAEASRASRNSYVSTFLISPALVRSADDRFIRDLLSRCATCSIVAMVNEVGSDVASDLLHLGALGVHHVVCIAHPSAWNALREKISSTGNAVTAGLVKAVSASLFDSSAQAQRLFVSMAQRSPYSSTVQHFSNAVGVWPSTLTSRFHRAGIPSLKLYLSMFRLLHVTGVLAENKLSVATASHMLQYSSPQSLSRHVQLTLGMSVRSLRTEVGFRTLLGYVLENLFAPYRNELACFQPFGSHMLTDTLTVENKVRSLPALERR